MLFFTLLSPLGQAQKVGVVLSGGGAAGVAHVGVLKALEANNIPIDYIAGTSMGALVGGMYAMGYTPSQIESLILSDDFAKMVSGKINNRYYYFFRQPESNASWIGLKFYTDSTLHYRPPANMISPINMDFGMMQYTARASAASGYNFDSLFVPFRCVAADIHNKKEVIFSKGDLGVALRASSAYPFYLKPVSYDNKLLFDGGLYNNFPADVMYADFLPDVIIGSTVVSEMTPPVEDDLYSQIKNMVMERTSYTPVCEEGAMIIIKPRIPKVSILDFGQSRSMVDSGYVSTLRRIEEIRHLIPRVADSMQIARRRKNFVEKAKPITITSLEIQGLEKNPARYVAGIMRIPGFPMTLDELRPYYYRLALDDKISKIYPTATYLPNQNYQLKLQMKPDKDYTVQFGGVFSSRPVNMGFIALKYKHLGFMGLSAEGNAYFGKFYSSAQVKTVLDFPFRLPFLVEADFTLNNFDFFNSASTFFEDTRPSYLIQYEEAWNGAVAIPVGNKAKIKTGYTYARLVDDYYQTQEFLSVDTADRTKFSHNAVFVNIEGDHLNRKQFANSGGSFLVTARYFNGVEENIPGSTGTTNSYFRTHHEFYRIKMRADKFLTRSGWVRIGLYGEAVLSNQPLFNNYTASQLQASVFSPFPESRTLFLPNFRAHQYIAGGMKLIFPLTSRFDIRLEGYVFQPYKQILENPEKQAYLGQPFEKRFITGSAALVYNSPLAPISFCANYYQDEKNPFSFIFTVGYLLFNRKATE